VERAIDMADQGWTAHPTWTSGIQVPEMWPTGPLGSKLPTEHHFQVEPYFQDKPFYINIAFEEGQN
jgi:hypothetical protein